MFDKKNEVKGIRLFCFCKEVLYTVRGNRRDGEAFCEDVRILDKSKIYAVECSDRGVFINTRSGTYLFKKDFKKDFLPGVVYRGLLQNDVLVERINDEKPKLLIWRGQSDPEELLHGSAIISVHIEHLYLVIFNDNLETKGIAKYSKNEKNWEVNLLGDDFELEEGDRIKSILGVLKRKLWVSLNNHKIIALSTVNGDLISRLTSIENFKCDWLPPAIPAPEAMQIHQQRGKLVGLMWEFYWEIDPENGEIDFHDLTDYFKSEKIRNDRPDFVLGKDHIYFISRHDSKLGALNIDTKRLDWVHAFAKNENGVIPEIMELKGNDHILGALDRGGTLHVFEREV